MALSLTFLNPLVPTSVIVNPHPKITSAGRCCRVNCAVQIAEEEVKSKPLALRKSNGALRSENDVMEDFYSRMSTKLVSYHADWDTLKATSTPIYQTATFKMSSPTEYDEYYYSRTTNPTREALEVLLAKIDNAKYCYCFSSGMSALTAVCELVNHGDEIITVEDIYGGSYNFIKNLMERKQGIVVKKADTTDLKKVREAMSLKTKLVWLESPSNPQLKISDIKGIARIAHAFGAVLFVDNSVMSPVLSTPLDLGADIVMHSATKFIAGNGSCLAGSLATNREDMADHIKKYKDATGCGLSPMDSWICLEGIKTMALRVAEKQKNARQIASFLASHPKVKKVNYPGLSSHPGYELHHRQSHGPGSVISFTTDSLPLSTQICKETEHFGMSISFGGVGSSICLPWYTSHRIVPEKEKGEMGVTKDLVRISVGIENVDQLIEDLEKALNKKPF